MIILARILTPEDFGIVAVATLAVFFLETMTTLGAKEYVAKVEQIDDDIVNTAWTLNFCIKMACWICFFFLADEIAFFLNKPEVADSLRVLSFILPITCFGNPGMMIYRRELNYKPQFKVMVISKLVSFPFVIGYAVLYESHWAMIYGTIINYAVPAILSYYYSSHRPRFCFKNVRLQWRFSKWIVANGVLGYSKSQVDSIIVSKYFSLDTVGIYGMFKNLAMMPISLIIQPATEPLLASFSRVKTEGGILPYQINASILLSSAFVIPLVTMMILFHHDIILMILGEKWTENSIVFAALSPMLISFTMVRVISQLIIAKDKISSLFYFDLLMFFVATIILVAYANDDVENFALVRSLTSIISMITFIIFIARKHININFYVVMLFGLPVVSAFLPGVSLSELNIFSSSYSPFFNLIINCSLFMVCYIMLMLLLLYPFRRRHEVSLLTDAGVSLISGTIKSLKKVNQK